VATCAVTYIAAGGSPRVIGASYAGDVNFVGSSGSLSQVVSRGPTATVVTSSVNQSVTGQNVIFTATISSAAPSVGTPTGTVSFTDSGAAIGCAAQPIALAGTATCSIRLTSARNHPIIATYTGDGNFNASNGTDNQAVNKDPTTTTITSSPDPANPGQVVTYTASATANLPGSGTPTGVISFTDAGTAIASCTSLPLAGGKATCTHTYATTGNHAIVAKYIGDTNFNASVSTTLGEAVANCGSSLASCNLMAADLVGAGLIGANLTSANLTSANLTSANLTSANLTSANLTSAILTSANLTSANLTSANLTGATLTSANLTNANLTNANLKGANLKGANLKGANLSGVTWSNTVCPDGTNSNADGGTCLGHL
jgi:uncharacterized protein YjbI with pentapeptide repeats